MAIVAERSTSQFPELPSSLEDNHDPIFSDAVNAILDQNRGTAVLPVNAFRPDFIAGGSLQTHHNAFVAPQEQQILPPNQARNVGQHGFALPRNALIRRHIQARANRREILAVATLTAGRKCQTVHNDRRSNSPHGQFRSLPVLFAGPQINPADTTRFADRDNLPATSPVGSHGGSAVGGFPGKSLGLPRHFSGGCLKSNEGTGTDLIIGYDHQSVFDDGRNSEVVLTFIGSKIHRPDIAAAEVPRLCHQSRRISEQAADNAAVCRRSTGRPAVLLMLATGLHFERSTPEQCSGVCVAAVDESLTATVCGGGYKQVFAPDHRRRVADVGQLNFPCRLTGIPGHRDTTL